MWEGGNDLGRPIEAGLSVTNQFIMAPQGLT
jgi:hypothetical protein